MCIGMVSGNFSRYYNTYSKIHLLNPLCKILSSIIFMIMVFMASNLRVILCLFLILLYIIIISNVPLKNYIKPLFSMKILFVFIFLLNLIFGVSLYSSIVMISKVCLFLIYFSILLFTTTTNELAAGFSSFLSPLSMFGVSVSKVSMTIALSINFIPTLFLEANKILKSQKSRGFDYNSGGFKSKLIGIRSIFIPMFISSIRRLDNVSDALEMKQFSFNRDRSCIKGFGWNFNDVYVILCHLIIFTLVLVKEVVL